MQFFEPGAFEVFVSRLAAFRRKPPEEVWVNINHRLDELALVKRQRRIQRLSIAASFALLLITGYAIVFNFLVPPIDQTQPAIVATESIPTLSEPSVPSPAFALNTSEKQPDIALQKSQTETSVPQRQAPITVQKLSPLQALKESSPAIEINNNQFNQLPVKEPRAVASNRSEPVRITNNEAPPTQSWSVIVVASPAYTYHSAGILNLTDTKNEVGRMMWGGGITVQRKTSRTTSLSLGAHITPIGQHVKDLHLVSSKQSTAELRGIEANTSFGQVSLSSTTDAIAESSDVNRVLVTSKSSESSQNRLSQSFHYLEIPFMASKSIRTHNFEMNFKVGASAALLVSNRFEMKSHLGNFKGSTEGIKPVTFAAHAAVSFSYPVSHNLSLHLEPTLTTMLQPLYNSSTINLPVSYSLKVGVGYTL